MTMIEETRQVWQVITLPDSGCGEIAYVCDNPLTAKRLAHQHHTAIKKNEVRQSVSYKIGGKWYIHAEIRSSAEERERYHNELKRSEIISRMREKGFSDAEIKLVLN